MDYFSLDEFIVIEGLGAAGGQMANPLTTGVQEAEGKAIEKRLNKSKDAIVDREVRVG